MCSFKKVDASPGVWHGRPMQALHELFYQHPCYQPLILLNSHRSLSRANPRLILLLTHLALPRYHVHESQLIADPSSTVDSNGSGSPGLVPSESQLRFLTPPSCSCEGPCAPGVMVFCISLGIPKSIKRRIQREVHSMHWEPIRNFALA